MDYNDSTCSLLFCGETEVLPFAGRVCLADPAVPTHLPNLQIIESAAVKLHLESTAKADKRYRGLLGEHRRGSLVSQELMDR